MSDVDDQKLAAAVAGLVGGDAAADVTFDKVGGGASNVTRVARGPARSVIVRMPPPGAAHLKAGAHDVIREARLLERLQGIYALAPKPLLIVDDASVCGVPFFAMEKLEGLVLRSKPPKDVALGPDVMRGLSENFVDALAALHAIDVEEHGLVSIGKPTGYVQRQTDGWRERYEKSKTDEVSDMERASSWLKDHVPATAGRVTLVHNDFKYDNCVVDANDPRTIVGVLDWELATVGDPMTDLATSLAYWVEGDDDESMRMLPLGLTYLPGNLTRTEVVARYEEKTGRAAHDLLFHTVLAYFKVAVICQQIYFRFAKGFSTDPRFAGFGLAVAVIAAKAGRVLDAGRIDVR